MEALWEDGNCTHAAWGEGLGGPRPKVWSVRGCRRQPARCVVRRLVELALNCGGGEGGGSTMRRYRVTLDSSLE